MLNRYFPIIAGVIVIVGLTTVQVFMTDRLASSKINVTERAKLLSLVPKDFGDWHGQDKDIDEDVRKVAGAVGAVSRDYRNSRTGERVDLWLIVGHARDVAFHTPDICYPGAGFDARSKENGLYPLVIEGRPNTPFWTNTFYKEDVTGRRPLRVFWTWYNPANKENQGKILWEAPTNARWTFGNSRALYKMYFTSEMPDAAEPPDQSACIHFARDFLPEVEKALMEFNSKLEDGSADEPVKANNSTSETSTPANAATPATPAEAKENAEPAADARAAAEAPADAKDKP